MPDESRPDQTNPEDLFYEALSLGQDERAAYLDRRLAENPALHEEISRMLVIADAQPDLLEPPEDLALPEQLGKYRILAEVGRGGMGVVYRAEDIQLGRIVALKVLPSKLARDAEGLARFEREARLLAAQNAIGIATLHSLEHEGGIHYFTMEFVEGDTLASLLSEGCLPKEKAIRYCLQIAAALESAHAAGIVHRDLKPANIMVTPQGDIKVLDFGIAKSVSSDTDDGKNRAAAADSSSLVGTPGYMSPEQIRGDKIDQRADMWAFGCVALECFAGVKLDIIDPLAGPRSQDRTNAELQVALQTAPEAIQSLVRACLEQDPGNRRITSGEAVRIFGAMQKKAAAGHGAALRQALPLGVLVAAIFLAQWFLSHAGPVAAIKLDADNILKGLDSKERVVWTRPGGSFFDEGGEVVVMRDIEGNDDLPAELAAVFQRPDRSSELFLLDGQTGNTIWQSELAWQNPARLNGIPTYSWLEILNLPPPYSRMIAAGIRDGIWYSSGIEFLSMDGRREGIYYHPGPAFLVNPSMLPGYDHSLLRIYGDNSSARFREEVVPIRGRAHCGFVALLELCNLSGQAYPYSEGMDELRDWPGMDRSQELRYLLIPPVHPDFGGLVHDLSGKRDSSGQEGYTAWMLDGRMYSLDSLLVPRSCFIPMTSTADSLDRLGEANFYPLLLIEEGEFRYIDVPLIR